MKDFEHEMSENPFGGRAPICRGSVIMSNLTKYELNNMIQYYYSATTP